MGSVEGLADELDRRLAGADAALLADYPGDRGVRQPVHTVYVPGDRFDADTVVRWGAEAVAAVKDLADLVPGLDIDVLDRVRAKLEREPIEDLRIDFEDGYGVRPDDQEDADVLSAARALAASVVAGSASPYNGIRIKSFEAPTRRRGLRTLDLFVGELGDGLTDGFRVTLPKVTLDSGCNCVGKASKSSAVYQAKVGMEYRVGESGNAFVQAGWLSLPGAASDGPPSITYPRKGVAVFGIGYRGQFK